MIIIISNIALIHTVYQSMWELLYVYLQIESWLNPLVVSFYPHFTDKITKD